MTTVFADTFYYVALLSSGDEYHCAAYEYTEKFDGTFVTTAWVITEVANFMSNADNRAPFLALLSDLENDDRVLIVPPTDDLFKRGLVLFADRSDKNWSLTDCISFIVMQEHRLTDALTADRHFEQAGFMLLLR